MVWQGRQSEGSMDSPSPSWLASVKSRKQAFLYSILFLTCCGCFFLLSLNRLQDNNGEVSLKERVALENEMHASVISRKVSDGIRQLDSQVHTLDTIRDKMWDSLHHAQKMSKYKDASMDDEDLSHLHKVAQEALHLRDELQRAADSERSILVGSEEILDGGCKDHHKESCGHESCCSFWARKGQCSANNQWMAVMCSRSCSTCSQEATQERTAVSHSDGKGPMESWHAAKESRETTPPVSPEVHNDHMKKTGDEDKNVDVSLSLDGVIMKGINREQLDEILRKAVAKASKKPLKDMKVKLDSFHFSPDHRLVKRKEPIRRERAHEFVHGVAPEEPALDSFVRQDDSFSPRRRLLEAAAGDRPGTLNLRFRIRLSPGEDQKSITDAIKAELHDEIDRRTARQEDRSGDRYQGFEHLKIEKKVSKSIPEEVVHAKPQPYQALHQGSSSSGSTNSNFEDVLSGKANHPDVSSDIPSHSQDASQSAQPQWVSPLVGKPRAYSNGYGLGLGINKKATAGSSNEGEAGWTFLEPFEDSDSHKQAQNLPVDETWKLDDPQKMRQASRPEDCGEECSETAASASREDGRKEALRVQAVDQVKLKKEQVIEDSRTLKHLLSAIAEESILLNFTQANSSSNSPSQQSLPPQLSMKERTSSQIRKLKQKALDLEEGAHRQLASLRGRALSPRQENVRRLSQYYVDLAQQLASDGQTLQQRLQAEKRTLRRFQRDGFNPMGMGRRRGAVGGYAGGPHQALFVRPLEHHLKLSPRRNYAATESNIRKISQDLRFQTEKMNRESEDFRQLIRRIRRETDGA